MQHHRYHKLLKLLCSRNQCLILYHHHKHLLLLLNNNHWPRKLNKWQLKQLCMQVVKKRLKLFYAKCKHNLYKHQMLLQQSLLQHQLYLLHNQLRLQHQFQLRNRLLKNQLKLLRPNSQQLKNN